MSEGGGGGAEGKVASKVASVDEKWRARAHGGVGGIGVGLGVLTDWIFDVGRIVLAVQPLQSRPHGARRQVYRCTCVMSPSVLRIKMVVVVVMARAVLQVVTVP